MSSSYFGGLRGPAQFNTIVGSGYEAGQNVALAPCRLNAYLNAGIATDQIDGLAAILHTYIASTPQTIDLSALTDVFGNALSVARVRFLAVKNLDVVDGHVLTLGNSGGSEWTGLAAAGNLIKVYPTSAAGLNDGFALFSAPGVTAMAVDGTHKLLKCDPGANAFQAIYLIGTCSA